MQRGEPARGWRPAAGSDIAMCTPARPPDGRTTRQPHRGSGEPPPCRPCRTTRSGASRTRRRSAISGRLVKSSEPIFTAGIPISSRRFEVGPVLRRREKNDRLPVAFRLRISNHASRDSSWRRNIVRHQLGDVPANRAIGVGLRRIADEFVGLERLKLDGIGAGRLSSHAPPSPGLLSSSPL